MVHLTIYKIILIGDLSTGKSNLLTRYTKNEFCSESHSTIGVDFMTKPLTIHNQKIEVQIWDCAGQERYRSIVKFYFRGAHGIILVYDISHRESFYHIQRWLSELAEITDLTRIILLIGNKSDLDFDRKVSFEEGARLAQQNNLLFLETSALTGANVIRAFETIIMEIYNQTYHPELEFPTLTISEPSPRNFKNYCPCW